MDDQVQLNSTSHQMEQIKQIETDLGAPKLTFSQKFDPKEAMAEVVNSKV